MVIFEARDNIDSQRHQNAVCEVESEKNPVDGITVNFVSDTIDQAFYERKTFLNSALKLTCPYIDLENCSKTMIFMYLN